MNEDIVIVRMIAWGGMSNVYHAVDKASGKEFAIKSCDADSIFERNALEKEYDIYRRLNSMKSYDSRSLNIPYVYGLSEYDNRFLKKRSFGMIMEYIDGILLSDALKEILKNEDGMTGCIGSTDCSLMDPVIVLCGVLDILHSMEAPVYYCDVKPENIIIRNKPASESNIIKKQKIMIIDFGSACFGSIEQKYSIDGAVRYGTISYAAPEQFEPEAVIDARTDIYGIGKLLSFFIEKCKEKHMRYVCNDEEKLLGIIKKCTCPDRTKRYCDTAELLYDLYDITGQEGIVKSTIII